MYACSQYGYYAKASASTRMRIKYPHGVSQSSLDICVRCRRCRVVRWSVHPVASSHKCGHGHVDLAEKRQHVRRRHSDDFRNEFRDWFRRLNRRDGHDKCHRCECLDDHGGHASACQRFHRRFGHVERTSGDPGQRLQLCLAWSDLQFAADDRFVDGAGDPVRRAAAVRRCE